MFRRDAGNNPVVGPPPQWTCPPLPFLPGYGQTFESPLCLGYSATGLSGWAIASAPRFP